MTFLWNFYLSIVLIIMMCGIFRITFKVISMIKDDYNNVTDISAAILLLLVLIAFPAYLLHNGLFAEIFVKAWPF